MSLYLCGHVETDQLVALYWRQMVTKTPALSWLGTGTVRVLTVVGLDRSVHHLKFIRLVC